MHTTTSPICVVDEAALRSALAPYYLGTGRQQAIIAATREWVRVGEYRDFKTGQLYVLGEAWRKAMHEFGHLTSGGCYEREQLTQRRYALQRATTFN